MRKKDIMFWFVIVYVIAVLALFVIVDTAKASALSSTVAVLSVLVTAQVGAIGWNINTDKKITGQNSVIPPLGPDSIPKG